MKYKVKYYETAIYTFEVEANDEDHAWEVAHNVMLGGGDYEGSIRLDQPEGIEISCDVLESEWDIVKA